MSGMNHNLICHQTDKTAGYESVEMVSEHKLKIFVILI